MELLLAKISNNYGLHLSFVERVTKGFLSENYILSDGEKRYFLKKYRFNSDERVREVHLVKKYFADGGIPVISPISDKEGNTFFLFENGYFSLFPFISDKQLERGSLTEKAVVSLGHVLGKIHVLGKDSKLTIKERFKPWDKENALEKIKTIESVIKDKSTPDEFDKMALESIDLKRKLILSSGVRHEDLHLPSDHLIHGDYLDHNVFFGVNDDVSYVFDFEKTDYSPRTYELFRSLTYSFLNGTVLGEDITRAKLYLESYLKIYPTSKDELSRGLRLFYLKSIHGVWVESEHYLKENARVDEFLSNDLQRIKYLSVNYEYLEDNLLR